jgi:putative DNA primase/helicase
MSATPQEIARRLGLHRSGREWRGTCPLCGYRDALALGTGRNGASLLSCHSCDDRDGLRALLRGCGAIPRAADAPTEIERREREARTRELAFKLWRGSDPAAGTLADRYLTARGLAGLANSPALRFRDDCPQPISR